MQYQDQWNIFARELEKILNARGLRIGQLDNRYDEEGFPLVHAAKADRLTKSLDSPCNFAVLSPTELERLEHALKQMEKPLTADDLMRLRAGVMATAVERILMERMDNERIALIAANDVFNILYAAMKQQPDLTVAHTRGGSFGKVATGDPNFEQAMDLIDQAELALHAHAQTTDAVAQVAFAQEALQHYDHALASLQASQIPAHDAPEWTMWFEATQHERAHRCPAANAERSSTMSRRALLVGIDYYEHFTPLSWCVTDALAMLDVLAVHGNGAPNFNCHFLLGTKPGTEPTMLDPARVRFNPTFNVLKKELENHFSGNVNPEDTVLLYYSGHGYPTLRGRVLVAQDSSGSLPGLEMNELLDMANNSPARTVILLIDTCFSGGIGDEPKPKGNWSVATGGLRDGVTILAATKPEQEAIEVGGHGIFTDLLIGALKGGATDIRGRVNAAGVYAYVEQALGPWAQRPVYKSNASRMEPLRLCEPDITDAELRRLPDYFPKPTAQYQLAPSYEVTVESSKPDHVAIFRLFKRFQTARLLRPFFAFDRDLYWVAMRSNYVELTPLGQFYWQLAKDELLTDALAFTTTGSTSAMPYDPESVAKLFHETYERLAPFYQYQTRDATRKPWEAVPENNKRLMIAVAVEVLGTLFPAPMNQQPAPATAPSAQPTSPADAPAPRGPTEEPAS